MKKHNIRIIFSILLTIFLLLVGCSSRNVSIVGTWEICGGVLYTEGVYKKGTVEFNVDKSNLWIIDNLNYNLHGRYSPTTENEGTIRIEGLGIFSYVNWQYTIHGNKMDIYGDTLGETETFFTLKKLK